ncbi:hypothetical protein ACFL50_04400 [Candidatus Latescibacterota bacterium]
MPRTSKKNAIMTVFYGVEAYDPVYGARPVKRYIQKEIENILAREVLAGKVSGKVKVDVRDGKIIIK